MSNKKNNNVKRWAILSAIALEMGIVIYGFVQLGKWLDATYSDSGKLNLIICTLAGVGISLFLVVRQTNKLNS